MTSKRLLHETRFGFFREKYRFDQGNAFLVFFNFALLVISVVKQYGGNESAIPYYVMLGLSGTWLIGYILDRFVRVQDIQERVVWKRSPLWQENFGHHDTQTEILRETIKRLEDLETLIRHEISIREKSIDMEIPVSEGEQAIDLSCSS